MSLGADAHTIFSVQLQSHTPVNSTTNWPNPGILTVQSVPFTNSSVHVDAFKVILKVTYGHKNKIALI